MDEEKQDGAMGQVIQIDEGRIRDHLGEMVRRHCERAAIQTPPHRAAPAVGASWLRITPSSKSW